MNDTGKITPEDREFYEAYIRANEPGQEPTAAEKADWHGPECEDPSPLVAAENITGD